MRIRKFYAGLAPAFLMMLFTILAFAQTSDISIEETWKQQTGAVFYGGVRADESRIYAGGEDGVLRALEKETGKVDWTYDAGSPIASNATVDDLRVYVHARDGSVHAVDKSTGNRFWRFATGGERQWDYWDYYLSTPAVDDRQVYFGSGDHHVYALEKRSGHLRWKVETGNIVHGEPAISGEKVIVGGFDGRMYAIDRGTGRVLWKFKTVGNSYFRNGELPGAATVSDGLVYFGGRDYNIYVLLEGTGTGAWNDMTPSWIVGRPLVVGDDLVLVNSDGAKVFSYNRKTGQLNWEFQNSYNMFAGAEALGPGFVVVASLDGRITLLNRADGGAAAEYATEASRKNRGDFFKDDGSVNYAGVRNLEDLMVLYDRQLEDLGGIPGTLVTEGDRIYYATAGGEIAALRVRGIELPATEQP